MGILYTRYQHRCKLGRHKRPPELLRLAAEYLCRGGPYSAGTARPLTAMICQARSGLSTNIARMTTAKFMIAVTTNTVCQLPVEALTMLAIGTRIADAPLAV